MALRCSLNRDIPALVRGDATRIRQVLTNLASNSIKFTERGEVKIHAEVERQTESTILVCVTVQDTGIGISEERQERLFQPFIQADASMGRN